MKVRNIDIYKCQLVQESKIEYLEGIIDSTSTLVNVLSNFGIQDMSDEVFVILCLNAKGTPVGYHEVSHGDLTSSVVHPREIMKRAILNNAYGIVLAHNHPSGDSTPSKEDISVTKRIIEVGEILGIKVMDHVVLGHTTFTSMKAEGII